MSLISDNLLRVQERIHNACIAVSRPTESVKLIAVSKTKPIAQILDALSAGQNDFGENYLQEALPKISLARGATWHYIGAIQSNKTRDIAQHFDWVHTVSSTKVGQRLHRQRGELAPPIQILLQVNLNNEQEKAGVTEQELPELVESLRSFEKIQLRGLMAIPEKTKNQTQQRTNFSQLARLRAMIQQQHHLPLFDQLSMGMSDDLEAAIAEGATWVRVGTAIFGMRQ